MNSDKFDRVVLDLLYGELDELTARAAKRHMDQSARAREIYAQLRAARHLASVPRKAAPDRLVREVLRRDRLTATPAPSKPRRPPLVSVLAGYAMRPQVAMGTLLLLMIGASILLLRTRPGAHGPVQVTERAIPGSQVPRVDSASELEP